MQRDAFLEILAQEGFPEPVLVTREHGAMASHAHRFEAKALIVAGEIHIRVGDGEERRYRVGDVFHLGVDVSHTERYGPEGVQYLAGRKEPDH
jgi:quercetin dioxygenase-like cupin family protein